MIQEQGPQTRELLAPSSSARPAVQATGHHVAVAGMLRAYRAIHSHDPAVQVANAQNQISSKGWVIGKHRRNQRTESSPRDRDHIFESVIAYQRRRRAAYLNVIDVFRVSPVAA